MGFIEYLRERDPQYFEDFQKVFGFDPNDPNLVQSFKAQVEKLGGDVKKMVGDTLTNPQEKPADKQKQGVGGTMFQKAMDLLQGGANKPPPGVDKKAWRKGMDLVSPTGKPADIGKGQIPDVPAAIASGVEQGVVPTNAADEIGKKAPWMKVPKVQPKVSMKDAAPEVDPRQKPQAKDLNAKKNQQMAAGG